MKLDVKLFFKKTNIFVPPKKVNKTQKWWRNLTENAKSSGHVKNEEKSCCIKYFWSHIFPNCLIFEVWQRIRGLSGWGCLDWRRCYPLEDCNLRVDSNQPKFLWYGMRANVPSVPAFNTTNRILLSFHVSVISQDIEPEHKYAPWRLGEWHI